MASCFSAQSTGPPQPRWKSPKALNAWNGCQKRVLPTYTSITKAESYYRLPMRYPERLRADR
ncbi:hypothetical protein GN958_ATG10747 [Phytophthora infestans]|uniref:Uncharacterized protein n=1 Tax=Phytophthora infestans TaxID=4787 RepID=A0A8S9UKG4_PHYIN|nr:hypothetical protein GN958_ATG10747 [Phytophthora infestans]